MNKEGKELYKKTEGLEVTRKPESQKMVLKVSPDGKGIFVIRGNKLDEIRQ